MVNKMINKLKQFWPYVLVILAIIAPWFFRSGYLFFTDFVMGPKIILDWQSNHFLLNLFFKILAFILPVDWLEKIFISFILFLVLLAGKILVEQLILFFGNSPEKISQPLVFILSLFLLFNPFVYDRIMYGQWGIILSYIFLIYNLAYLFKYFNKQQNEDLILAWVLVGLSFLFSPHFIFFIIPFFILFYCWYFKNKFVIKKLFKYSLAGLGIFIFLNINWLLPTLLNHSTGTVGSAVSAITKQDYLAFKTSGDTPAEAYRNVLMMSGFWGKDQSRYLDLTRFKENWGKSFLILIPFIIYGIYLSLKEKRTRFFSIGLLVIGSLSVFLAVGISAPVSGQVSLFLYNFLPFYKGMREPQKWVAVLVLVYFIYLGLGVWHLSSKKFIQTHRFALGVFLAGVIIMQAWLLFWGLNGQVVSTNYPADWYQVDQKIVKDSNCQTKVLFFPWHLYMSFNWIGRIVANPASVFFSCPVISGGNMEWGGIYDQPSSGVESGISDWVLDKNSDKLLETIKNENIGYLVLAKEIDYPTYQTRLEAMVKQGSLMIFLETPRLFVFKVSDKK